MLENSSAIYRTLDWKAVLGGHPLFCNLGDDELEWLLSDQVSTEQHVPDGTEIVHAGDWSNSVYLVGEGSVQVLLPREDNQHVLLTPLGRGECFGEMAAVEQQPRTANVVARGDCTLLEIKGPEFLELLTRHPDMEFKLLLKISERLRGLSKATTHAQIHSIDQRIELFASKLDMEKKTFDATLRAAEGLFDQTRNRTNEIISNAERNNQNTERTLRLLAWIGSLVVAVFTLLMGVLSWMGYDSMQTVQAKAEMMVETTDKVSVMKDQIREMQTQIGETKDARRALYEALLMQAVGEASLDELQARRLYPLILKSDYRELKQVLLSSLWLNVTQGGEDSRGLIVDVLGDRRLSNALLQDEDKALVHYIRASGLALDERGTEFDKAFAELKALIEKKEGFEPIRHALGDFDPMELGALREQEYITLSEEANARILQAWNIIP